MGASSARLKVVLRADAGPEMGYGHLVRTLALGEALTAKEGADCVLVTRSSLERFALPVSLRRVELPAGLAVEREGDAIAHLVGPVDWLVADLYEPTGAWRRALRGPWGLVFIDDDGPTDVGDLCICPNLETLPAISAGAVGRADVLAGAAHVLLRVPFANGPPKAIREAIGRVLVCFGGSDIAALTGRVVSWMVAELPSVAQLRVVTASPSGIATHALGETDIVALSGLDAAEMVDEMRAADVALLGAGTLLYEAAAVGLPALWVSLSAGQAREANHLARLGAGHYVGTRETVTRDALVAGLARLTSASERELASRRGRSAIDGLGCARAADRIRRLHEKRLLGRAPLGEGG